MNYDTLSECGVSTYWLDDDETSHRCAYSNSAASREILASSGLDKKELNEIMEVWGDAPVVQDEVFLEEKTLNTPTAEDRLTALEMAVAELAEMTGGELDG